LGTFDVVIEVTAYAFFFVPVPYPIEFEGYRVVVSPDGVSVIELEQEQFRLLQNHPNPFKLQTDIAYYAPQSEAVEFKVMDMLGQTVYAEILNAKRGNNSHSFVPSGLQSGIYLYSLTTSRGTLTKRMVYDQR